MTFTKGLLVGAVAALVVQLVGIGMAHAETDREDIVRSQTEAYEDLARGAAVGYHCELIQLADGRLEAQCDETVSELETEACSEFSLNVYAPADRDMAYEACMTIALHTGAVR